jgi:hypothetical protein
MLWNALRPIAEAMGMGQASPQHAPTKPRSRVAPPRSVVSAAPQPPRRRPRLGQSPEVLAKPRERTSAGSMAQRYHEVTQLMLRTHNVKVRKWRTSMSGIAWYVTYRDGSIVRLIEAPKPKGPMSMAVFLHEIGHHAIGFDVYSPRCLEEFHAWEFAIRAMNEHGLNLSEQVMKRRKRSLEYAVGKACRRGIKRIPVELEEFIPPKYRGAYAPGSAAHPPIHA